MQLCSPAVPLFLALAAPGFAQKLAVGDSVPVDLPLQDFSAGAGNFEEYTGRAVLIEFFAYW